MSTDEVIIYNQNAKYIKQFMQEHTDSLSRQTVLLTRLNERFEKIESENRVLNTLLTSMDSMIQATMAKMSRIETKLDECIKVSKPIALASYIKDKFEETNETVVGSCQQIQDALSSMHIEH